MQLNPEHLKVTRFNNDKPWYPPLNGVRITYLPTGEFAESGNYKSMYLNKAHALAELTEMLTNPKQLEFNYED